MNTQAADRSELFATLQELCEAMPEMRLGQLVVNLAYVAREPSVEAPWDVEDAELLAAAREMLANCRDSTVTV